MTVKKTTACLLSALMISSALSACSAPRASFPVQKNMEPGIEHAAYRASKRARHERELITLEKYFTANPGDTKAALQYARGLREYDYLNRASIVLSPFAEQEDAPADVLNEYTALQIDLGNYSTAERSAQQAVLKDPTNYSGYHNLGLALDALAMPEDAEKAYRQGITNSEGHPTVSLMNNLALNLASQGKTSEAKDILFEASKLAPGNIDIERNIRIVKTLEENEPAQSNVSEDTKAKAKTTE